jgi:hypothetical protein
MTPAVRPLGRDVAVQPLVSTGTSLSSAYRASGWTADWFSLKTGRFLSLLPNPLLYYLLFRGEWGEDVNGLILDQVEEKEDNTSPKDTKDVMCLLSNT